MITSRAWHGQRFAVLGLGRSGMATVRALCASGARVTAWDDDPAARAGLMRGGGAGAAVQVEDPAAADLAGFAGLVVSPGIAVGQHPAAARAHVVGVPVIGDIELFAQARSALPSHRVVGVTGTNGKSTTTMLIAHILARAAVPSRAAGNIGVAILADPPLPDGGVYVLELSSYQLDLTTSLDCDVAILLNITPDHLDRHGGFDGYAAAKERLFAIQSPSHAAIIGIGDAASAAIAGRRAARGGPVTRIAPGSCMDQRGWPGLQGPHNAQNALAAIEACRLLGVSGPTIDRGLVSFAGLPHRMEHVRDRRGVTFINDSKATNPASAAPALAAFDRIHWIVGGQAKTDDLSACAPHFGNVACAYTIGDAAPMLTRALQPHMAVDEAGDLSAAVTRAAEAARPGDTVLLSPACASFDQFSNFEERGASFRAAVGALA